MSYESPGFRWTAQKEEAARLVADDLLTNEDIAGQLGIDTRTLTRWKTATEFQARVAEHLAAARALILTEGIADRVERVKRINRDWKKLQQVIDRRAQSAEREAKQRRLFDNRRTESIEEAMAIMLRPLEEFEAAPGMMTGLIVREPVGLHGEKFRVDIPTLKEMRAMEMQVATELGQLTGEDNDPISDDRVGEELDRKLDSLAALLTAKSVSPEPDACGTDGA